MIYYDDCGAIGGIRIDRGNQSTQRKPAPVPLCPPQIPHDLAQARSRASVVESQQLTALATAQSFQIVTIMLSGKADKMLVYISIQSSTLSVTWYEICFHKKFRQ
jgi:hypothetical protein